MPFNVALRCDISVLLKNVWLIHSQQPRVNTSPPESTSPAHSQVRVTSPAGSQATSARYTETEWGSPASFLILIGCNVHGSSPRLGQSCVRRVIGLRASGGKRKSQFLVWWGKRFWIRYRSLLRCKRCDYSTQLYTEIYTCNFYSEAQGQPWRAWSTAWKSTKSPLQ